MDGGNLIFLIGFLHAHCMAFSEFNVFIGPVGHENVEST